MSETLETTFNTMQSKGPVSNETSQFRFYQCLDKLYEKGYINERERSDILTAHGHIAVGEGCGEFNEICFKLRKKLSQNLDWRVRI